MVPTTCLSANLNQPLGLTLSTPSLVFVYVQRCDIDGNGKLDYDEFKAMIFRYKARKEGAAAEEEDRLRKMRKKQIKKEPKKMGKTKGKGGKGIDPFTAFSKQRD